MLVTFTRRPIITLLTLSLCFSVFACSGGQSKNGENVSAYEELIEL